MNDYQMVSLTFFVLGECHDNCYECKSGKGKQATVILEQIQCNAVFCRVAAWSTSNAS